MVFSVLEIKVTRDKHETRETKTLKVTLGA
ncbi:uncharacterized protein METZ01_LOCUS398711 [marine metagenome]|uniref:Uncharacterized protein n=1 Tax=marine metagenome TaxID=408172 RepID=A0A382VHA2_9ZZZZ